MDLKSIFFIVNNSNTKLLNSIINKSHMDSNSNIKKIVSKRMILHY